MTLTQRRRDVESGLTRCEYTSHVSQVQKNLPVGLIGKRDLSECASRNDFGGWRIYAMGSGSSSFLEQFTNMKINKQNEDPDLLAPLRELALVFLCVHEEGSLFS